MTFTPRDHQMYRDGALLGSVCGALAGAALGAGVAWAVAVWVYWS